MKKLLLILAVLTAFLLGSCSSMLKGIVYDSSVPPEKSAKIILGFKKNIIYNGVPVKCKTGAVITVPAGRAAFTGDTGYDREIRAVIKNASFSCVLEAGKEYWAVTEHIPAEVPGYITWGVGLYEYEIKMKAGYPPKENLIAFIPFEPQIVSRW